MWQIKQYATRLWVATENSAEQVTSRAAHIDDRSKFRKVVGRSDCGRLCSMQPDHSFAEHRSLCRMACQPIKQRHSERFLEPHGGRRGESRADLAQGVMH